MLRLRSLLARQYTTVLVILIVFAAVGGWVTYTAHASPGMTTTERAVPEWEATGDFSHQSTVTEQNPVYEPGTTLSNRSVYFTTITPELDGVYTYTYSARDSGSVDGNVTVSLLLRAVSDDREGEETLWETRHQLNETNVSTLGSDQTVRVPFTANISAAKNRSTQIQDSLGTVTGQVRATIVADVQIQGSINKETVNNTTQYELPMRFQGQTYRVNDPGPMTASKESVQTVQQQRSYGPLWNGGGPLVLLGSLGGLGVVLTLQLRDQLSLTPEEQARLKFQDARADYAGRITTAQLPDEIADRPHVEVDSLEDLVNVAIDSGDAPVIEDPLREAFYVLDPNCCYMYIPPQTEQPMEPAAVSTDSDQEEMPAEQSVEAE